MSPKGRTLFEILTGRNKRDMTPLELQYHNPLGAKVGNTISFDHQPDIGGINFYVERISVYETRVVGKKFYHTDYHLKGLSLGMEKPLRFRLRLIADSDSVNPLGCNIQLLSLYDEMEWDEGFYAVVNNPSGEFHVNHDDFGDELEVARTYWRIEDVVDPYHSRTTILKDDDEDGSVNEDELERINVIYWDFSRETEDHNDQKITEFLTIEMNEKTKFFTFLRGTEVDASQITVI
jgi:hypothetical protein